VSDGARGRWSGTSEGYILKLGPRDDFCSGDVGEGRTEVSRMTLEDSGRSSAVGHLSNMCEALGPIPRTEQKRLEIVA
jgi:hypothetical protein